MKTDLLLGVMVINLSVSGMALGQSTFEFYNLVPTSGVDAPVFDAQGVPLAGTNYLAELYGGPAPDSLAPAIHFGSRVRIPFFTGTDAGYFYGGDVAIPSVPPGFSAWLQVRAWDARWGATYEEVLTRGLGRYGESALFYAQGGGASPNGDLPGALIGLQSFRLRALMTVLIRGIHQRGDQVVIEWDPGFKRYQFQQTAVLGQQWLNVGEPTTATSATNSISGSAQFFRVVGLLE